MPHTKKGQRVVTKKGVSINNINYPTYFLIGEMLSCQLDESTLKLTNIEGFEEIHYLAGEKKGEIKAFYGNPSGSRAYRNPHPERFAVYLNRLMPVTRELGTAIERAFNEDSDSSILAHKVFDSMCYKLGSMALKELSLEEFEDALRQTIRSQVVSSSQSFGKFPKPVYMDHILKTDETKLARFRNKWLLITSPFIRPFDEVLLRSSQQGFSLYCEAGKKPVEFLEITPQDIMENKINLRNALGRSCDISYKCEHSDSC